MYLTAWSRSASLARETSEILVRPVLTAAVRSRGSREIDKSAGKPPTAVGSVWNQEVVENNLEPCWVEHTCGAGEARNVLDGLVAVSHVLALVRVRRHHQPEREREREREREGVCV